MMLNRTYFLFLQIQLVVMMAIILQNKTLDDDNFHIFQIFKLVVLFFKFVVQF